MKKILALFVFLAITTVASTQHNAVDVEKPTYKKKAALTKEKEVSRRKGYIGFSLGPSFPVGDFAKKESFPFGTGLTGPETTSTGLQLTLINFGYLFTEHIGIAGAWFGSAYSRSSNRNYKLDPWSCGGLMIGPLISFPISKKVDWDLRPMLGYSVSSGQREGTTPVPVESSKAIVFNTGTVFRIHVAKKISLLLTADYFSTKIKWNYTIQGPNATEYTIKALSLGFGFAYRLK